MACARRMCKRATPHLPQPVAQRSKRGQQQKEKQAQQRPFCLLLYVSLAQPLPGQHGQRRRVTGPENDRHVHDGQRPRQHRQHHRAEYRRDRRKEQPVKRLKTPVAEGLQDNLLRCEPFFRQHGVNRPQYKRALFDRERQTQPDAVAVIRR